MARSPTAFPRVLRIAAVPAAAFLAFAIWWLAGWGGPSTMRVLIVVGGLGFPSFAAVCTALAARRGRGRQRRAWVYMTVGLAAWAFSEVVVIYHRVWVGSVHPLYPSVANAGFLLFPVAACVAMLVLPAGYPGRNWFRILLDGAIVAAALFVVSWLVVLRQAYAATRVKNAAAIVSLAYPVLEVVTVTVAVLVLARAHARWRVTVALLTVGLTLIAASGAAYEYLFAHNNYAFDNPVGLGWSAGVVIVGIAALTCVAEPPYAPPEPPASVTAPQMAVAALHSAGCRGRPRTRRITRKSGIRPRTRCRALVGYRGAGPPIHGGRRKPAACAQHVGSCATRPIDQPGQPGLVP